MENIIFITNRKSTYLDLIDFLSDTYHVDISGEKKYSSLLLDKKYDLIIIDTKDDTQVLKDIKSGIIDKYYKYVPVFVIGKDKRKKEYYLDRGAYDYIMLPISNDKFATFIYNAIDQATFPKALKYSHSHDKLTDIFTEETFRS